MKLLNRNAPLRICGGMAGNPDHLSCRALLHSLYIFKSELGLRNLRFQGDDFLGDLIHRLMCFPCADGDAASHSNAGLRQPGNRVQNHCRNK